MEGNELAALAAAENALKQAGPLLGMGNTFEHSIRQLVGFVVKLSEEVSVVKKRLGLYENQLSGYGTRLNSDITCVSERIDAVEAAVEMATSPIIHRQPDEPDERILHLEAAVAAHHRKLDEIAATIHNNTAKQFLPPPVQTTTPTIQQTAQPLFGATPVKPTQRQGPATPVATQVRSSSQRTVDLSILSDSSGLPTTSLTELRKKQGAGTGLRGVPEVEGEILYREAESRSSSSSSVPIPRRGSFVRPARAQTTAQIYPPASSRSIRSSATSCPDTTQPHYTQATNRFVF